ncbi:hypothetical protein [Amaricoccus sp. W119]|uniref:hypothetical protein n=1 Tax=Amaricoccus sp. W119 TaxID=3391833 RepID=UPI0039A645E0
MSKPVKPRRSAREIETIRLALARSLRDDPNVIGVGFGANLVDGRPRGSALIIDLRVMPEDEAGREKLGIDRYPDEYEGLPVRVEAAPMAKPDAAPTGERGGRQEDPLLGGTSTAVLSDFLPFPTGYGTLGGICFDTGTGRAMALSNAHVWGEETAREVIQPWMPVDEYVEGVIKLLSCGPITSYLADTTPPSGLTAVLAAGAAGAWTAAAAADDADPSRWGQDETAVDGGTVTQAERVRLRAEVPANPMPGHPYVTATDWQYTRVTSAADLAAAIAEDRRNAHVTVKNVVTERQQYSGGERVRICADILGFQARRARDHFVVARCFPLDHPERIVTRVLRPGPCGIERPDRWECFDAMPRQWLSDALSFPLHFGVFRFDGAGEPVVRSIEVANVAGASAALRIPLDGGLGVEILPTRRVRVDVSHTFLPVTVLARDPIGRVVTQATSGATQGHRETLELEGTVISRLTIVGGGGEGWLHGLCVDRPKFSDMFPDDVPDQIRIFSFTGQLDLGLREDPGRWGIIVSVQTVDNSPPRTDPVTAAQNIAGIMSAPMTAQLAGCVTVLLLDHAFDVI